MKRYYVYILQCSDDSYYTGVTNNLERRLGEHETGKSQKSYTATRLPLKLVYYEIFDRAMKAIKFEKQVKGWSRKKKEALIERNWSKLKELSACKNSSHYSGFGYAQPDCGQSESKE